MQLVRAIANALAAVLETDLHSMVITRTCQVLPRIIEILCAHVAAPVMLVSTLLLCLSPPLVNVNAASARTIA